MSRVKIDSHDGPDEPKLVILGHEDYYVSVDPNGQPATLAAVRFRTSGGNWGHTWLIAALFHFVKGHREQACNCAQNFIEHVQGERPMSQKTDDKAEEILNTIMDFEPLQYYRTEAALLLRSYRARDPDAIKRVEAVLRDVEPDKRVTLMRVQHVVAREAGCKNWSELKKAAK